jgi:hypothetical protein
MITASHGKKSEEKPRRTAIFVNDRSFLLMNRSMGKETAAGLTADTTDRGMLSQGCGVFI